MYVCVYSFTSMPPPPPSDSIRYLDEHAIPAAALEHEKALQLDMASGSNKPQAIVDKMIEGRLRKFYGEVRHIGRASNRAEASASRRRHTTGRRAKKRGALPLCTVG